MRDKPVGFQQKVIPLVILSLLFFSAVFIRSAVYNANDLDITIVPFKNHYFWSSSYGILLKGIIDITVVALLLWVGVRFYEIPSGSFATIYRISAIAYSTFLFQYWVEFAYIKIFLTAKDYKYLDDFTLFSLGSFLKTIHIKYPNYLAYPCQVITVFELIYWIVLVLSGSKLLHMPRRLSIKLVLLFYILPFFCWLAFVLLLIQIF